MIEIDLIDAGKRFNRDWIFRHWNRKFDPASAYVITGGNGSGKSTALRSLLGYSPLSEGSISYFIDGQKVNPSHVYRHFSFCSPYLELYEELTLDEMARFHFSLKPPLPGLDLKDFAGHIQLEKARNKAVKFFSSGMKQRLRLGLALYSDTAGVFLDEPVSNLDRAGINWYRETVTSLRRNRLLIVASNMQEDEYFFCDTSIAIDQQK